jgi:UDP-glucuronate 4-epimerase
MNKPIAVVTGAAGFIGSHLTQALLAAGWSVRGIDCLTDFYSVTRKRANLANVSRHESFRLHELDLSSDADLAPLLDGASAVFHFAAEAGVRTSWGTGFERYVSRNVLATQRLLETIRERSTIDRVVVASSSSVYGDAETFPTPESGHTRPVSPYGITKLATEQLARVYARNWGMPTVSLRLFTVFGPRQRPDMAFHRIVESALTGAPFQVFGSGEQIRDFTYVADVVRAAMAAADASVPPGAVFNVAGGSSNSLNDAIREVESLTGRRVNLVTCPVQPGDPHRTGGDTELARTDLGWKAEVDLRAGLAQQVAWHESLRQAAVTAASSEG